MIQSIAEQSGEFFVFCQISQIFNNTCEIQNRIMYGIKEAVKKAFQHIE